jgi:hypothetical protein
LDCNLFSKGRESSRSLLQSWGDRCAKFSNTLREYSSDDRTLVALEKLFTVQMELHLIACDSSWSNAAFRKATVAPQPPPEQCLMSRSTNCSLWVLSEP